MAKKRKNFSFTNYMDPDALQVLMEKGEKSVKPTVEEIKILNESKGYLAEIPLSSLVEYEHHTFKVMDNEDMAALVDSIRMLGIVVPPEVRKIDDSHYEVLAGHRRKRAAEILGLETIPCLVTEVDDETAAIISVDTNLHRSELLPSEKAKSYDLRINAMRLKGLADDSGVSDSTYAEIFAEEIKSSRANVSRYRKLLKLSPALLEKVDSKEISVNAGAALADIPAEYQECIELALKETSEPLTIEIAEKIATASRSGLTKDKVLAIIGGDFRPRKKKSPSVSTAIKEKNIKASYPSSVKKLPGSDKEAFIIDCINEYINTHDSWNGHKLN